MGTVFGERNPAPVSVGNGAFIRHMSPTTSTTTTTNGDNNGGDGGSSAEVAGGFGTGLEEVQDGEGGDRWRLEMAIGRAERALVRAEEYKAKAHSLELDNVKLRLECENWRVQVNANWTHPPTSSMMLLFHFCGVYCMFL